MKWLLGIFFLAFLGLILAGVLHRLPQNYRIIYTHKNPLPQTKVKSYMTISSTAFKNNEAIPQKYTCEGQDVRPELDITDVPKEAQSLAIVLDDPDAPKGTFTHWIVYNISPTTAKIASDGLPGGSMEAVNSFGKKEYGGPCPPSGTHYYHFTLYALDRTVSIPESASVEEVKKLIISNAVDRAVLSGTYTKQ